jgi:transposase-like protein
MKPRRPALFRKRQFERIIIVASARWYCRFSLSLRDLKEMIAEHGLAIDSATIWRRLAIRTGNTPATARKSETKISHVAHQ